jgi:membrane-bound lytic murein transglycosylase C
MAVIHTESGFNPEAFSKASAYGLMQLVPHTAGQEAYYWVYGQRRPLTPQYLYDPNNNIELGTAYLHILRNGYLGSITDPTSRTYCAVAAYHAGPSNVGRAFIPEASIKLAIPVINQLSPADVYKRLVEALPSIESRNYVRDVIKRMRRYGSWYSKDCGAKT